jgi:hypothetical protein
MHDNKSIIVDGVFSHYAPIDDIRPYHRTKPFNQRSLTTFIDNYKTASSKPREAATFTRDHSYDYRNNYYYYNHVIDNNNLNRRPYTSRARSEDKVTIFFFFSCCSFALYMLQG